MIITLEFTGRVQNKTIYHIEFSALHFVQFTTY